MLQVVNHPLIQHKLGLMRDIKTPTKEFRELCGEIASLLCFEATKDLSLEEKTVKIWTGEEIKVRQLAGKKLVLVPIWRAGTYLSAGVEKLIPTAKVNPIGVYRDETTQEPRPYYENWCSDLSQRTIFIMDPMLATGGTIDYTISRLRAQGCHDIRVVCLVASIKGKETLEKKYPAVPIFAAALDPILDKNGYIRPGLGDAGDRLFGPKDLNTPPQS